MSYEIRTKDMPARSVVTMRMHTSLPKIGEAMRSTLDAIGTHVKPRPPIAMPFAIYYNEPFKPDDIDVEMGVPIERDAIVDEDHDGIHRRELPAGTIAYTVHHGAYATIGAAYKALFDWLDKTGRRAIGAPREVYIVGPDETQTVTGYVTEIEVPIS